MEPFPADEKNQLAGKGTSHDDLVLWMACKEARALMKDPINPSSINFIDRPRAPAVGGAEATREVLQEGAVELPGVQLVNRCL